MEYLHNYIFQVGAVFSSNTSIHEKNPHGRILKPKKQHLNTVFKSCPLIIITHGLAIKISSIPK